MLNFNEFVEATVSTTNAPNELESKIAAEFKRQFPHGEIWFRKSTLGGSSTTFVSITMLPKDKISGKIVQNDPIYSVFSYAEKNGKIEVELSMGSKVSVHPKPNSYLAIESVKVPFRKFSGDAKKVVDGFAKHFKKMKDAVDANKGNIYGVD